jgi:hypothetical protein
MLMTALGWIPQLKQQLPKVIVEIATSWQLWTVRCPEFYVQFY